MDLYSGIFAFSQTTFPILTAIPLIVVSFKVSIPTVEVKTFYGILLIYFILLGFVETLALLTASNSVIDKLILLLIYSLILTLSAASSYKIASWTIQEQITRLTGLHTELADSEALIGDQAKETRARKKASTTDNKARKKKKRTKKGLK